MVPHAVYTVHVPSHSPPPFHIFLSAPSHLTLSSSYTDYTAYLPYCSFLLAALNICHLLLILPSLNSLLPAATCYIHCTPPFLLVRLTLSLLLLYAANTAHLCFLNTKNTLRMHRDEKKLVDR